MIARVEKLPEAIESLEDLEAVREFIHEGAQLLTNLAASYGLDVTISKVPKQPLAMGNWEYQCEVSASHWAYRGEHD